MFTIQNELNARQRRVMERTKEILPMLEEIADILDDKEVVCVTIQADRINTSMYTVEKE